MPHGKICYLEIPANAAQASADFYCEIFGWKVRERGDGNLAFGVSKAGIDQMTRELAVEWAPRGIRVNSILPCQFLNSGLRGLVADPVRARTVERMVSGIPIGRMGEADEIVGPILFLASPAASMVTGVNLPVDGGNLAFNAGGSLPAMNATW